MFSVYKLKSSFVAADVAADIVGILTGTITDVSQLSSSCNIGGSTLIRTMLPEWEVHDNAAAAATAGYVPRVLKSQWTDSETHYKYLRVSAASSSMLHFTGYLDWNATTHVGTDPINPITATYWGTINLLASGTLIISASKAHCSIFGFDTNFSISVGTNHSWFVLSEYTRDDPWNAVSNGYHSWLMTGANLNISHTANQTGTINVYHGGAAAQVYNISTGLDLIAQPWFNTSSPSSQWIMGLRPYTVNVVPIWQQLVSMQGALLGQVAVDINKAPATLIYPVNLTYGNGSDPRLTGLFLGGNMSAKSNALFATKYYRGVTLDEIQVGDDNFALVNFAGHPGYNATFAIRKV